ncbi:MAG: HD domain-containing phosphohydrolase [Thermodesulfobacteriota bacterium]|nr:HD domain-containing phosphohydrolase [Thermodesulfobacteriota bacterium]
MVLNSKEISDEVKKLNQIGIALSGETNLKKLLELIVKETRAFTKADAGSLYLVEDDKLHFEVMQNDTIDKRIDIETEFKPYQLPLTKDSIAGYVAITKELINIEDAYNIINKEYKFNKDFDNRTGYKGKSMLVVPMKDNENKIIGVLQLINSLDENGVIVPFDKSYNELVSSLASQAAVAVKNAKLLGELKALFGSLIEYSTSAIDARSPHTAGHSKRVASYAKKMAKAINLKKDGPLAEVTFSPEEIEELNYAAWLHDIGKIGVKEYILDKEYKLSLERLDVIRERFRFIKKCYEVKMLKEMHMSSSDASSEKAFDEIAGKYTAYCIELDELFAIIDDANSVSYLSDGILKKLDEIMVKKFFDGEGNEVHLLTSSEFKSLSVKHGNLTHEEYDHIQSHVIHTKNILSKIPFAGNLKNVPFYAASHHEMLDGSGYSDGLHGDELPVQSRILAIADVYDALTAFDRPYKKALGNEEAIDILKQEARNGKLDPHIVDIFIYDTLYHVD